MSKWFEVLVKCTHVYNVEIEDDEDAETALEQISDEFLDDFDEMTAKEITSEQVCENHDRGWVEKDKFYTLN